MFTSRDYAIGLTAGFLTAVLLVCIFLFFFHLFGYIPLALLLLLPLVTVSGLWLSGFLSRYVHRVFFQFGKYAAVGLLSATIDFFTLNLVSYLTHITAGIVVGWVNAPGFLLATLNAYLWNKLWVFGAEGPLFVHFPRFFFVTTVGLFLNSTIVVLLTTYISFPGVFSDVVRLNLAKVVATAVTVLWNFSGYKFIAFATRREPDTSTLS